MYMAGPRRPSASSSLLASALMLLCGAARASNPNLKYIGMYGLEAEAQPSAVLAQTVNMLSTSDNLTTIRAFRKAGFGPSLLPVQSTFFCGQLLCPDYRARWAKLLAGDH